MKRFNLLIVLFLFALGAKSQVLNIQKVTQERTNWCWAGCSKAILDYYGYDYSQCQIAEFARENNPSTFGSTNCCNNSTLCNEANYLYGATGSIQDILFKLGAKKSLARGAKMKKSDIERALACDNFFIVRWGWRTGGGHFVVGHGIKDNSIYYMDPWFGEGKKIADYDWMVDDNVHEWTHSLVLVDEILPRPEMVVADNNPSKNSTSIYTCKPIDGAEKFKWILVPSSAGTLTETHNSVSIKWNPDSKERDVNLYVKAYGNCSESENYLRYPIQLRASLGIPGKPSGQTTICHTGEAKTQYSVSEVTGAENYTWQLSPTSAGQIVGNGNSITVNWRTNRNYNASLSVAAVSATGEQSDFSDELDIILDNTTLPTHITPLSENSLCNTSNSEYLAFRANVKTIDWTLKPATAGAIKKSDFYDYKQVDVDWKNDYIGEAKLYATVINACGTTASSEEISIQVNGIQKPAVPTGKTTIKTELSSTYSIPAIASPEIDYTWTVVPEAARNSISVNKNTCIVKWNSSFVGNATISISTRNSCGTSAPSLLVVEKQNPCETVSTPNTIAGETNICLPQQSSTYSTPVIASAESYIWKIEPKQAATLQQNNNEAILVWNSDFTGDVSIQVAAKNTCGQSDFSEVKQVHVQATVHAPSAIEGKAITSDVRNTYTTLSNNATSYTWKLTPQTAGNLIQNNTQASIVWNTEQSVQASLSVTATNACGTSTSTVLEIQYNKPCETAKKPNAIAGETNICLPQQSSTYSTPVTASAESYIWKIEPKQAATLQQNKNEAVLVWNSDFTGDVSIQVAAENTCGQSDFSEVKQVHVQAAVHAPSAIEGKAITSDVKNTYTTLSDNATSYTWKLTPQTAGNLIQNNTQASIVWNTEQSALASLSVTATNACGTSTSTVLEIQYNKPCETVSTPNTITGETNICLPQQSSTYSTPVIASAESYIWKIEPKQAATLQQNKNEAVLVWNSDFTGDVNIQVAAENACGEKSSSITKTINVSSAPKMPEEILGESTITQGLNESSYYVESIALASSYTWLLTPSNAGQSSGNNATAKIIWNSDFHGDVQIKVAAQNMCGTSKFSDVFSVSIEPKITTVTAATTGIRIFPNPSNGTVHVQSEKDNFNLQVYDNEQKLVFKQQAIKAQQTTSLKLDAGVYFFITKTKNNIKTKKIVITK